MREAAGKLGQQPHALHDAGDLGLAVGFVFEEVEVIKSFGDDVIHLGALIQACHGILKDHLHLLAVLLDLLPAEVAAVGMIFIMARPMVVLPLPDSPTRLNVSPRYTSKDTPLTA